MSSAMKVTTLAVAASLTHLVVGCGITESDPCWDAVATAFQDAARSAAPDWRAVAEARIASAEPDEIIDAALMFARVREEDRAWIHAQPGLTLVYEFHTMEAFVVSGLPDAILPLVEYHGLTYMEIGRRGDVTELGCF